MVRGILLSIFLLITFQNYAEENELEEAFESILSETKSLLPTTVHNVSVISGEWIDSEIDFYIEGAEPLSLTRCYSPGFTPNPIRGPISDNQIDYYAKNPVAISKYHCGSKTRRGTISWVNIYDHRRDKYNWIRLWAREI